MSKLRQMLFEPEVSICTSSGKPCESKPAPPAASTSKLSLSGLLIDRRPETQLGIEESRKLSYQKLKSRIHMRLIESIDIQALIALDQSEPLETAIERTVHALIDEEKLPLTAEESRCFV